MPGSPGAGISWPFQINDMMKSIYSAARALLQNYSTTRWLKERIKFEWLLRRKLKSQLSFQGGEWVSGGHTGPTKRILIPILETSHYQYLQILILAKALEIRGAKVKLLVCGSRLAGCELKNVRNSDLKDPCFTCRFNLRYVVPMFGLDFVSLSDFISETEVVSLKEQAASIALNYPDKYLYNGINIIPMVNDSVIRFYYGAIPSNKDLLKNTREQHLTSSMIGIKVAERIDESWSPDIILNNMFVYSAWEPYSRFFGEKSNRELFLISISQYNFSSIVLNILDIFKSNDRYMKYKMHRKATILNEQERKELTEFFAARKSGDSEIFKQLNFFDQDEANKQLLKVDSTKRNLFLFSNIYWDVGMSEHGQLFSDVINWVIETISIIKENRNIHLYIKTHPGEKYDSSSSLKGIVDFIYEKFPVLPTNVSIIYPDLKINTYDLFPFIDLGIVFNGTVGIEMMLQGIPVVVTGKAPYGRLGLVYEPSTTDEYKKILLGETKPIDPDKDEIDLFCYFYFIKVRMPWNLTEKAYDDNFKGYTFNTLDDISPGKNKYLDHLCSCILDSQNTVVEGWE